MSSTIAVITMTAPLFLILACLAFTVVNDPYIQRDRRRTMLLIIAACLTLIAQNLLESPWRQENRSCRGERSPRYTVTRSGQ